MIRIRLVLLLIVVLAYVPTAPAESPFDQPFIVGVQTHFGQDRGIVTDNLRMIRDAGVNSIRDELFWAAVERSRGKYEVDSEDEAWITQAGEMGLSILLLVLYANPLYDKGDRPRSDEAVKAYANYAEFLVNKFQGTVRQYAIWNEWDIGIGLPEKYWNTGGTPDEYLKLMKAAYPKMKAVNPGIQVVGGVVTPMGLQNGYLAEIVRLGALDYCDVLSLHTYNAGETGRARNPEAWADWMLDVRNLLRQHNKGEDFPVYITEMGWPTNTTRAHTPPDLSAAYLGRLYLLACTMPFIRGIWWYDFQDDGWDVTEIEHNFGMVWPDLSPKPSYLVLRDVAALAREGVFDRRIATGNRDLHILQFRHKAEDVWAMWVAEDKDYQVVLRHTEEKPEESLSVQLLGHAPIERWWGYSRWAPWPDGEGADGSLAKNELSVVVGARPKLIRGKLANVTVKLIRRDVKPRDRFQEKKEDFNPVAD